MPRSPASLAPKTTRSRAPDANARCAVVQTPDGRVMLRDRADGTDPVELGRRLARHLLDDAGGSSLLDDLR